MLLALGTFWLGCGAYDEALVQVSKASIRRDGGATPRDAGEPPSDAGVDAGEDAGKDAGAPVETVSCAAGECWWSQTDDAGCKHAGYPSAMDRPGAAPDALDDKDQGEIYLGWTQLRVGTTDAQGDVKDDAWQGFGLDLDGVCTNSATCPNTEQVSCRSLAAQQPFDGELCRDNTFASLQPVIAKVPELGNRFGLSEDVFNCALWRGSYNIIVRISGYNGRDDDPSVRVDWYISDGLETPQGWSCPHDDYRTLYPLWRASLPWRIDASLLEAGEPSTGHLPDSTVSDPDAYVREGYLVASIPDAAVLRLAGDGMPYRGFPLKTHRGVWLGKLEKIQDGTWHMHDGLAAGVTSKDDLIESFRQIGFCEGQGLDSFYQSMVTYVNENADMLLNGGVDQATPCDAMSFGLAFEAAQVTPGMPHMVDPLIECCPPGMTLEACNAVCGDGVINGDERCDKAIDENASGSCPKSCEKIDDCTPQKLVGKDCDAHCEPDDKITQRLPNDGCCPDGADANTDSDCAPVCDNGVLEAGETCDPIASCPSCSSDNPCLQAKTSGSKCKKSCGLEEITSCMDGDHCCPSMCSKTTDTDCPTSCGNHQFEPNMGETCEQGTSTPCPASCDDNVPCTNDLRTGNPSNCNVVCTHVPITELHDGDGCCPNGANANTDNDCGVVCGNGVTEGSEQCDDMNDVAGDGCDKCMTETPEQRCVVKLGVDDACSQCSCSKCMNESLACYGASDASEITRCKGAVDCGRAQHCTSVPCYCGDIPLAVCVFIGGDGPCIPAIEAAAGTSDLPTILAASTDTTSPLGRANALADCATTNCQTECGL